MFRQLAVLFGLTLLSALCWAQPRGNLIVQVFDITTGTGLNNARVQVTGSGGTNVSGTTGGGNAIRFNSLPILETYTVSVTRADYRSRTLTGVTLTRDADNYVNVYLTSGLQTVGAVAGTVRDAMTGLALSGVYVVAGGAVWTFTDSNGHYRIEDLPRGVYGISADKANYHSQTASATVNPNSTTTQDLVLTPLSEPVGSLRGNVYDILSGTNVNSATVTLVSDRGWSLTLNTGGGNRFQWDNLPVRIRYQLAATAQGYRTTSRVGITLSYAYTTEVGLFVASALTSVGTLQGTVFDIRTGNPIPNAYVEVGTQNRPVSVFADNNGVFQINDLPPVTYYFYASSPNHYAQQLNNVQVQQGSNTANILLTSLDMGVGAWTFRAYDFGTGGNVGNVTIRLTAPNGRSMVTATGSGSNAVGIGNLPIGTNMLIEAFAPNYRSRSYANQRVRLGQNDEFGLWLVSEDINVGRLTGQVTDIFTGAGVPNASVVLSQVGTGRWALTYTDANGNFSLGDLFPGTYHVTFDAAGYGSAAAYNVPIAVGDNLLVFALQPHSYPGGRLYGDVINNANNQGIAGSTVLLIASTGTTRLTYTGGGSRYDFYELPYDLRYTVVGQAPGFQPGSVSNIEVPAFSEIYVPIRLNAGAGGLVGRLVLDRYDANPAGLVQALVQIRDRNTHQVIREETVTLGDSGAFVVPNAPSGVYEVRIKASHWLSTVTGGVNLPNLIPFVFLSGANGDRNGDNVINNSDLTPILTGFGSNTAASDLNGNGVVDDKDLAAVLFAFGRSGQN